MTAGPRRAAPAPPLARFHGDGRRVGALLGRPHARDLHRDRAGERAALDGRQGDSDGSRRSTGCFRPRRGERKQRDSTKGQARRAHCRDPATDRPLAARHRRLRGARRADRLGSTVTCCRPTAARAAPRSPAATSPCTLRSRPLVESGKLGRCRSTAGVAAVSGGRRRRHSRCSTSTTQEDSTAEVDMNVVRSTGGRPDRDPGARPRASRSTALALDERSSSPRRNRTDRRGPACSHDRPGGVTVRALLATTTRTRRESCAACSASPSTRRPRRGRRDR